MENKQSIAIYHIVKISDERIKKSVQSEARVAEMFIKDVETKFEYALFNAPEELSYMELYLYFMNEWKRMLDNLRSKKFKFIRINSNHFENQYKPVL